MTWTKKLTLFPMMRRLESCLVKIPACNNCLPSILKIKKILPAEKVIEHFLPCSLSRTKVTSDHLIRNEFSKDALNIH